MFKIAEIVSFWHSQSTLFIGKAIKIPHVHKQR